MDDQDSHAHEHDNGHDHQHGHGHDHDQGWRAMLRYLRHAPRMWRSATNDAVINILDPQRGDVVVDIGAGVGPGTVGAAKRGAQVIAVEPTAYMRNVLTGRRLLQRSRNSITVVEGAAEKMPVATSTATAVISVNTMHHWSDVEAGAREIKRVLCPGGRVVLVDEDFENPLHPDHDRFASRHGDDHSHGFSMVDAQQMGSHFTAAGLVNVEAVQRDLEGRPVIAVTASAPN